MADRRITRRAFGGKLAVVASGLALPAILAKPALAADTVRHGLQIGAMGPLRTTLPEAGSAYDLAFDVKDFRDSTSVLLALEQGELEIGNTTTQHLIRAINEEIPVRWVCGWGGGYNVLVSRAGLELPAGDGEALKAMAAARKAAGSPLSIGVPTGSLQHAKVSIYLASLGIDPEADVAVANIPFPNHPRALEAGEVDLAMTLSVFGALAIDKGDASLFLHLFDQGFGKQEIGFIVTERMTREQPEMVQRIVNAHVDAISRFMGQPEKQIEYETAYSRLPPSVIEMQEREFLRYNFRTSLDSIRTMASELHGLGWAAEDYGPRVADYVDLSFLAQATGLGEDELSTW